MNVLDATYIWLLIWTSFALLTRKYIICNTIYIWSFLILRINLMLNIKYDASIYIYLISYISANKLNTKYTIRYIHIYIESIIIPWINVIIIQSKVIDRSPIKGWILWWRLIKHDIYASQGNYSTIIWQNIMPQHILYNIYNA